MHLYFMGIAGTAMGNVALLMRSLGHTVSGADEGVYPPMSTLLKEAGVDFFEGYDAERLEKLAPDLVVVGNVVSRGHPEMEWLLESRAFPTCSLPELLSRELLIQRRNLVVGGTHGKTTTSSLAAWLLRERGHLPGWLIGGVPRDLPGGAESGREQGPFVIEGDEYDSAFFDKRSKFLHYRPDVLVINNIEFDHADIFRDLEDVLRTFRHVSRIVPRNGAILLNLDDGISEDLLPISWTRVITVGTTSRAQLQLRDFHESETGSRFELFWEGRPWAEVSWQLHGLYNARNLAMAALGSALVAGVEPGTQGWFQGIERFEGVKRRQEKHHGEGGVEVFEDFGHHPTALREALASFRNRYPKHRLVACLEPRSNTMRTRRFQDGLEQALAAADHVLLGPVHRAEAMSAEERLDTGKLCEGLSREAVQARAFEGNEALLEHALDLSQSDEPTLYCFFTNGSFGGILPRFVESVKQRP